MGAIRTPFGGVLPLTSDPVIRRIPTDSAAANLEVPVSGEFVAFVSVPAAANLTVRFNGPSEDALPVEEGDSVDGLLFARLFLTFSAVSGGEIVLFISGGSARWQRL